MRVLLIFIFFSTFFSCSEQNSLNNSAFGEGMLVHTVFLDLKDDVSKEHTHEIIKVLKSLEQIKETKKLFVALKAETDDPRAKVDYDIVLQMGFQSMEHLKSYSENNFHLEVREQIKEQLAKTPLVYDYWVN